LEQGALTAGKGTEQLTFELTSLDQLLLILQTLFPFLKTSYLNEEVNRTEPSLSASVPWLEEFFPFHEMCNSVHSTKSGERGREERVF
jgi:hypothetical protein